MKRLICFILSILMMFGICVNAHATINSETPKKEPVDLISFCELFVQRLIDINDQLDIDTKTIGFPSFVSQYPQDDNMLVASSSAGTLTIRSDTLSIEQWFCTIIDSSDDHDSFMKRTSECAAAISALEYDAIEGGLMSLRGYSPAMIAYTDIIYNIVRDRENLSKVFSDDKILIYDGNYDYYIFGSVEDDETKKVFIIAE